jgi:nucleoside-diphosphate-sugar epimerase
VERHSVDDQGSEQFVNVLVTGGSGYIGSRLCRRLVNDGHAVSLLVRSRASLELLGEAADRAVIYRHAETWKGIYTAVRESKPDLVFHLASLVRGSHEPEDIGPLVQSNVQFGAELLEAMTKCGVSRLIMAGTFWQHFGNEDYDPVNLYAATKQAFEDLLLFWSHTTPLRTIVLTLFDVYGLDDPRPKLIPLLLRLAFHGGQADLTPGEQLVDIVHVDDAVEAFVLAGARVGDLAPGSCERYSVSSGAPIQLRDLVSQFEEVLGRSLPIRWGGRPYRHREVMRPWSKGVPLPGWRPTTSLRDGFRQLIGKSL